MPRRQVWNNSTLRQGYNCAERSLDRKSTRLNSSHLGISYAVFCLKKKKYFIASQFIAGQQMEAAMHSDGMEPIRAVRLVIHLLYALAYAHERVVLHCFFFNDTATTEIYTLSLHDALPILPWNPNRIEQRFGRIHRIGQHEVCH